MRDGAPSRHAGPPRRGGPAPQNTSKSPAISTFSSTTFGHSNKSPFVTVCYGLLHFLFLQRFTKAPNIGARFLPKPKDRCTYAGRAFVDPRRDTPASRIFHPGLPQWNGDLDRSRVREQFSKRAGRFRPL